MFKPCSLHNEKRKSIIFSTRCHRVITSQWAIIFIVMIYCTLVQHCLPCTVVWLELLNDSSSSDNAWEDTGWRFSHLHKRYYNTGVCQRLFWPGAVCFQDIKTSGGGIRLHCVFAVVGLCVSHCCLFVWWLIWFEICLLLLNRYTYFMESAGVTDNNKMAQANQGIMIAAHWNWLTEMEWN